MNVAPARAPPRRPSRRRKRSMPQPLALSLLPLLPVMDAITSTLLPVNAAAVRFAEPMDHVTCQPCSTAIILACSPDGRASTPVPASPSFVPAVSAASAVPAVSAGPSSSLSAGPSSASPCAVSDRTKISLHAASASSDSLSSSSCRLTSIRSFPLRLPTASSPVRLANGATASVRCPLDGGLQVRRPRANPIAWNAIGDSKSFGAGNAVRQT